MDKEINEIYGFGGIYDKHIDHTIDPNTYKSGINNPVVTNQFEKIGIETSGWQKQITKYIIDKQDLFISIPPSAGKTFPVQTALIELYQKSVLRTGPKIFVLYVVPRKQLAAQISENDFIKKFINLFNGKNEFKNEQPGFIDRIKATIPLNQFESAARSLVAELVGGNKGLITDNTCVVIATYDVAKDEIIPKYKNRLTHIFVDETQELLPHPGEGLSEGLLKRYDALSSILINVPRSCSITLMTGSVNDITIKRIVKYFNIKFRRDFKLYPEYSITGEQKLNRSDIKLSPLSSLDGFPNVSVPNRLKLCKNIIVNNQTNSIMIIFSKQKSGQGIFKMIEELIKALPAKPTTYFDSVDGKNYIRSQAHMDYVKKAIKTKTFTLKDSYDIEFLKWFDFNSVMANAKMEDSTDGDLVYDENNPLYQGVLRGVAPLVGSMNQLHKKIVQNLFIDKKIQLLLATDALGI